MAGQRPKNGVPRGVVGWAGRTVYHGTADEDAADILENGVVAGRGDGYCISILFRDSKPSPRFIRKCP